MIILQIVFQDLSQMPFSQHNYMIQAVTPDGSNQPLHVGPLPWNSLPPLKHSKLLAKGLVLQRQIAALSDSCPNQNS